MAIDIQEVEFKTIDGLTLRGDLYSAAVSSGKGPAVIITPGVCSSRRLKEMIRPKADDDSSIASKRCLYQM